MGLVELGLDFFQFFFVGQQCCYLVGCDFVGGGGFDQCLWIGQILFVNKMCMEQCFVDCCLYVFMICQLQQVMCWQGGDLYLVLVEVYWQVFGVCCGLGLGQNLFGVFGIVEFGLIGFVQWYWSGVGVWIQQEWLLVYFDFGCFVVQKGQVLFELVFIDLVLGVYYVGLDFNVYVVKMGMMVCGKKGVVVF